MVTDATNNALPPLPPVLPRFEHPSLRAGGGSSVPGQRTPPLAGIILQPGTCMSGVSSLTSSTPVQRSSCHRDAEQAGAPNATPLRRSPRRKLPAEGRSPDDNVLSPHVPLLNLAAEVVTTIRLHLRLGCSFLLLFLQSETPPKGILQESFSFLSKMEESFFIFLQFGPPPKGTGFLWF